MHFLQTPAWEKFQNDLGKKTYRDSDANWSYMAILEKGKGYSRLYCPYGPWAADEASFHKALDSLKRLAKKHKVTYLRLEPDVDDDSIDYNKLGFIKAHKNIQPKDTITNDTSISPDEIMSNMSQTPRRMWRKNKKENVSFTNSYEVNDIEHYIKMIHDVSNRTHMKPHTDEYFRQFASSLFPEKNGGLLFAEQNGEKIASILFMSSKDTLYYAHAASLSEYRKLSPATALAIHALIYSHESNHKKFDFYGVAPEDAPEDHPWKGFTKFKQSFGGERYSFSGTWELPINKLSYKIYRTALSTLRK